MILNQRIKPDGTTAFVDPFSGHERHDQFGLELPRSVINEDQFKNCKTGDHFVGNMGEDFLVTFTIPSPQGQTVVMVDRDGKGPAHRYRFDQSRGVLDMDEGGRPVECFNRSGSRYEPAA